MNRIWPCVWLMLLALWGCAAPQKPGVGLRLEAVSANDSGYQYYLQGRWSLAEEKFAEALKYNRLIDHRAGIAANLNNLGAIAQGWGQLPQAEARFREALTISREMGDSGAICETLNNLGTVYLAQGRLDEARNSFQEALRYADSLPPGPLVPLTLTHLGDVARVGRDYSQAMELYCRALELDRTRKDLRGQAVRWERMGRTHLDQQNYAPAAPYLHDALREFRRLEDTNGIVDTLNSLTRLSLAQGDREGARLYGERLLKIYQARDQEEEAKKLEEALKRGAGK